ncbi:cation-transporting P-type ATPase [Candidatus Nitrospira inopinata]|uniref:Putative cation-transporting ATPase F n=1 Tax=Candidatus Nitrospira inopinata TaxID=1715989 RepID=A0A0S4KMH3_9BACT|nr:cation-transporting P-type ATPase [Candidatus Nitrospira inopinata]CUQ65635.1 putative cation-transporting ATPase F [Candidatus Nitrospira inopinata]
MTSHHHLPAHEVVLLLETDVAKGLTSNEAARRLARFGPNLLPKFRRHGPLIRFLFQFHHPLIYVLLVATVVTMLLGEWVDAAVIFGVVFVNAIVGFIQESRAEAALDALASMMTTEAKVRRDGRTLRIPSEEIVPGDVVLLESGDKVPADLRLTKVRELRIDESALTGESLPVEKVDHVLPSETVVSDRKNMAFSGTFVTYGQGTGVVVSTGVETELGRIHQLMGETTQLETPLTQKLASFSKVLTVAILGLAALTFLLGLWRGQEAKDIFMAAVALAVGAIPEGLPAAVTITLAIGVSRMAKRNAIIRKLPAVETLGSTTVICSDKTGTLTKNEMTVQALWVGQRSFEVDGAGYEPVGEIREEGSRQLSALPAGVIELLTAGILCNDAQHVERDGRWTIIGDPTEGALLVAARKAGLDPAQLNESMPRLDAIPFESERQFMATLHRAEAPETRGAKSVIYLKGAVEKLIPLCDRLLELDGAERPFDSSAVLDQVERFAARGLRVLAFARKAMPAAVSLTEQEVKGGLTLLGLQAMIDPPRPEAIAAVRACQQAGIAVKMITGDHAVTARAIAAQIGLDGRKGSDGRELIVMTGQELAATPQEQLVEAAERTAVFARVSPEQKLRLVEALQARSHVVAMTGDGVNDAPALKQANIGVAMGRGGTEVAKEAADMVLTDDNFASIEAAVEEGRCVFDNLTKFIVWTLPTNMGEGLVLLAAIALGTVLPILPVQILWINMTTAVALGLMLAFEPKEPGIMTRPPRDPNQPILTGVLIERIFMVSFLMLAGAYGVFLWELDRTESIMAARTAAVNVFVMVELFYLFNCRSLEHSMFYVGVFSNPWIWVGVTTMTILQLLLTYVPVMNRLFHTVPIDGAAWVLVLAVALIGYAVVEVETWLRKQWKKRSRVGQPASG